MSTLILALENTPLSHAFLLCFRTHNDSCLTYIDLVPCFFVFLFRGPGLPGTRQHDHLFALWTSWRAPQALEGQRHLPLATGSAQQLGESEREESESCFCVLGGGWLPKLSGTSWDFQWILGCFRHFWDDSRCFRAFVTDGTLFSAKMDLCLEQRFRVIGFRGSFQQAISGKHQN